MENGKSDAELIAGLEQKLAEYRERVWRAESRLETRVALRKELEAALGFADGETYDEDKFAEAVKKAAELEAEVERLKRWKDEMLEVWPPYPEIGKALGIPLGSTTHDKILPGILALQAERDELARRCALAEAYLAARASSPLKLEEADSEEAARRIILDWRGIGPGDKVCIKCGGSGVRVYGSTSTWHGGLGGQQLTSDICDRCWGSGAENRPWLNLRNHARALAEAQKGGAK